MSFYYYYYYCVVGCRYRDDDDDKSDNSNDSDSFALTSRQKDMQRRKMQETILAAAEGTFLQTSTFSMLFFQPENQYKNVLKTIHFYINFLVVGFQILISFIRSGGHFTDGFSS